MKLVKEDPDGPQVNGREIDFDTRDAYTFIYSPEHNVFLYGLTYHIYHYQMVESLEGLKRMLSVTGKLGDINIGRSKKELHFLNYPRFNYTATKKNLVEYLQSLDDRDLTNIGRLRGDKTSVGYLGRYWKQKHILSFWVSSRNKPHLISSGIIEDIIKLTGLDRSSLMLDFSDTVEAERYLDLVGGDRNGHSELKSDEEVKAAMKKQHLDPEAKKKLTGQEYNTQHLKKLAQGHDYAAKANAAKMTSDGIIKLKDLIPPFGFR